MLMINKSRIILCAIVTFCGCFSFSSQSVSQVAIDSFLPPDASGKNSTQQIRKSIDASQTNKTPDSLPVTDVENSPESLDAGMQLPTGGPLPSDKIMSESAEDMEYKTPEELEMEIRKEAFEAALYGMFPMRNEEIRKLLEHYDLTNESVKVPVYPYPKPEVGVMDISLDPGVSPPVIKVAKGHITTVSILDVTGAPWPIQDISWAGNFEIEQPDQGEHIFRITPLDEYAYGNLSMRLLTLKTPITFILQTHRDKVYYRLDARVPEYGPFASTPIIENSSSLTAGNAEMTEILQNGGAPVEKLNVSGVDGRTTAYLRNGITYIRTPLTLLSPSWDQSVRSADGMNVYSMNETPVILLSDNGKMVKAYLSKKDQGYE